jgi:hypothetical protein
MEMARRLSAAAAASHLLLQQLLDLVAFASSQAYAAPATAAATLPLLLLLLLHVVTSLISITAAECKLDDDLVSHLFSHSKLLWSIVVMHRSLYMIRDLPYSSSSSMMNLDHDQLDPSETRAAAVDDLY